MPDKTTKSLKVNIVSKPPTFAIDGHSININGENQTDILFFQTVDKKGDEITINGVASIRMTFEQFKKLSDVVNKMIVEHEKKLKEKK